MKIYLNSLIEYDVRMNLIRTPEILWDWLRDYCGVRWNFRRDVFLPSVERSDRPTVANSGVPGVWRGRNPEANQDTRYVGIDPLFITKND